MEGWLVVFGIGVIVLLVFEQRRVGEKVNKRRTVLLGLLAEWGRLLVRRLSSIAAYFEIGKDNKWCKHCETRIPSNAKVCPECHKDV